VNTHDGTRACALFDSRAIEVVQKFAVAATRHAAAAAARATQGLYLVGLAGSSFMLERHI
jgi:hypothetical protein